MRITRLILFLLFLAASCSQPPAADKPSPNGSPPASSTIDGAAIKAHIEKLASDEMEGRAPGGKGEELATAYISDFYKSIGLKTQFQAVPFVGITSAASPLKLTGNGRTRALKYADEFVAWTKQQQDSLSANADLV